MVELCVYLLKKNLSLGASECVSRGRYGDVDECGCLLGRLSTTRAVYDVWTREEELTRLFGHGSADRRQRAQRPRHAREGIGPAATPSRCFGAPARSCDSVGRVTGAGRLCERVACAARRPRTETPAEPRARRQCASDVRATDCGARAQYPTCTCGASPPHLQALPGTDPFSDADSGFGCRRPLPRLLPVSARAMLRTQRRQPCSDSRVAESGCRCSALPIWCRSETPTPRRGRFRVAFRIASSMLDAERH